MEGGGVCPAMALSLISEGSNQQIEVDRKSMLSLVMKALGSRDTPMYTYYSCGANGFRVAIQLNMSAARYSTEHAPKIVTIEGDTKIVKVDALKSVVDRSIVYLSEKHKIRIRDYSSKVADELHDNNAFGYVNAAVYNVEKLLVQWSVVMDKCQSLAIDLAGKETAASVDVGRKRTQDVYGSLNDFINNMLNSYEGRLQQAKTETKDTECERKKYHSRDTAKYHSELRKGCLQNVVVEPKDLLDYVLIYLGAPKATYSNGPSGCMIKGVVHFNIPDILGIDMCGNLTIKGRSTNSRDAEQEAAYNALLYMEKTYHLKIVGLNRAERDNEEKEQRLLVGLLSRLVKVGNEIKKSWAKMAEKVENMKRGYTLQEGAIHAGDGGTSESEAYKFYVECVDDLAEVATKGFSACAFRFEELDNLGVKLEKCKDALDFD